MARTLVRTLLATVAALVLPACGRDTTLGGTLHVQLTTDKTAYTAGNDAIVTLRNLGDLPVTYNLCDYHLQHSTSVGWITQIHGGLPCMAVITVLQPGDSASAPVPLPETLPSGTYRVYYPIIEESPQAPSSANAQTRKSTNAFQVQP
jgi:hypothetical protein